MPGWRFGIDRHVYKLVRDVVDPESAGRLLSFLTEFEPDGDSDGGRSADERSAGADGLILIGGPDYSEKVWQRESLPDSAI